MVLQKRKVVGKSKGDDMSLNFAEGQMCLINTCVM